MKLDSRPLEIGRDLPTVDRAVVNSHTATLDRRVLRPKGRVSVRRLTRTQSATCWDLGRRSRHLVRVQSVAQ